MLLNIYKINQFIIIFEQIKTFSQETQKSKDFYMINYWKKNISLGFMHFFVEKSVLKVYSV